MDALDKHIINQLQYGFPLCAEPYRVAAEALGCSESELLARLDAMLESGLLSRFGPMYHAEKLGGELSLAAMQVAEQDFERVAEQVNSFDQVAHNYQRNHALNMWFVLATQSAGEQARVIEQIEALTGYPVYNMPKEQEYFVGLFFDL